MLIPVSLLDEATNSINKCMEKLIESGMDTLMENRTVFVIAHRLLMICNVGVILVIENGKIIEGGNHQELLAQKGRNY